MKKNKPLEQVQKIKYLGIITDSILSLENTLSTNQGSDQN